MSKLVIVLSLFLLSTESFGQMVFRVYDETTQPGVSFSEERSGFEVNKKLGRARVRLAFVEGYDESTRVYFKPVQVEGLSYNAELKSVVFSNPQTGVQTVCASYKRILYGKHLSPTGECVFSHSTLKEEFDDGFEIKVRNRILIDFNVNTIKH
jgi:hypothetical protein